MDEINWFSMFLATITPMLIGLIYYHDKLFGKALIGSSSSADNITKKPNRMIVCIISILPSFMLSFFLLVFNNSGIDQEGDFDTFQHGVWHGVFIAVTTVTPIVVTNAFFNRKNWKYVIISIFYWIITLALMGGMLDAMNHWENIVIPE